jgi:hypothetical protein
MRRRLVWIQGAAPQEAALFLLFEGPEGYYLQKVGSAPQLAAPFSDDQSWFILPLALTAVGVDDWLLSAGGITDAYGINALFYGPSGLVRRTFSPQTSGTDSLSGLFQQTFTQDSFLEIFQRFWYTSTGLSGSGPNTFPVWPPPFYALPGVEGTSDHRPNETLTWAFGPTNALDAVGNSYPFTSGAPNPWPRLSPFGPGGKEGRVGNAVGLTLFVHDLTPDPTVITTTPYTYDPSTGIVTGGTPFDTPYTHPGGEWILRRVSYWTSSP